MPIIEHAGFYETPMHGVNHEHFCCEIMLITHGEADITAKELHHICAGDLVLIKSRQHHAVRVTSSGEYRRYIVMINPWELRNQLVRPDLFAMLTDADKEGLIIVRGAAELRGAFDKMTDIFANGANVYAELSAALEVISAVYEQVKPRTKMRPVSSRKQLADRVRSYIERNYAHSIKIADIAAENFVSVGYLTHVFTAETGVSPREYLSHIRCARAYELIRHTAVKFTDISAATGFCCANDMSRKIREYYGQSPTQIRRESLSFSVTPDLPAKNQIQLRQTARNKCRSLR